VVTTITRERAAPRQAIHQLREQRLSRERVGETAINFKLTQPKPPKNPYLLDIYVDRSRYSGPQ
jgi:hypothetical protein